MDNELNLEFTEDYDGTYWSYNLPLQMWPIRDGDEDYEEYEKSPIIAWRPLNYMARKEYCTLIEPIDKSEIKTYCHNAAKVLRNLANRFDLLADGKVDTIYYPDEL